MSKHAAAFQPDTSILEQSINKIDNGWNTQPAKVEFNGMICPPVVSVSGLIDEIGAIDFFDNEKIDSEKITGTIFVTKNNPAQFEHNTKSIADENGEIGEAGETGNYKAVLQNLQNFRNRLTANNSNEINTNTITITNENSTAPISEELSVQLSDCVVGGEEIELGAGLINGNIFCNKNWRRENRSPEERLLGFSADDVPSFELVCKTRLLPDKLTGKKTPENNLTENNNQENQTNNHMSKTNNINIPNIVTINQDTKDKEFDCQKNIDNSEENNPQNNKRIFVTENNNDNDIGNNIDNNDDNDNDDDSVPLVLSLFKGEESVVGESDRVVGAGEVCADILSGTELLATHGLEKSYFKSKLKIPVLNGVNFAAYSGEFVSITGQSGSGKSTLLHLLGTLDKPDAGEIIFDGRRVDNLSVSVRDKLRNRSIGFIFQFYNLLPEFTALENVLSPLMIRDGIFGYLMRRRVYVERAKELLDRVGLLHRLRHRPGELSGGEIQRVAIARSLIIEPKLLLADEPTGNLDSVSAKEVIRVLRGLNEERNLTIVMVTHDNSIAATADRVVKMSDGIINGIIN
ncbi:MAG: ABC transporter ATP-binding protein [Planctomycetaceae bacterium]|jgi:lipoprotein-releasing system ATP-binding protein|nr:ABC transporter ATP-binding protein [Planctomycetaceae bacterium]